MLPSSFPFRDPLWRSAGLVLGALIFCVFSASRGTAQTIEHLTNGSFENPTNFFAPSTLPPLDDLPDYHRSGEWGNPVIDIPGWNMTALGTPDLVRTATHPDAESNHYLGTDGNYFISASANEDWQHEGLSTTFMVQAGVTYTFSFDHAQGGVWNDTLPGWTDYEWMSEWQASMTGAHTENFYALNNPLTFSDSSSGNPVVWQTFSAEFTPTSSGMVTLTFTTDNTDDFDLTHLFLDNVSVTSPIPEPRASLLCALVAAALVRRKRGR